MLPKSRIMAGLILAVLSISACAGQAPIGNQPNPIGHPQSTVDPKLPPHGWQSAAPTGQWDAVTTTQRWQQSGTRR